MTARERLFSRAALLCRHALLLGGHLEPLPRSTRHWQTSILDRLRGSHRRCWVPDIGTASLTRLTFAKEMAFADAASARHFSESKRRFIRHNRRGAHDPMQAFFLATRSLRCSERWLCVADIHYDFSEDFRIPGVSTTACKRLFSLGVFSHRWRCDPV